MFEQVKLNEEQIERVEEVRKVYEYLLNRLDFLGIKPSREKSLAITNLEQSCMWAIKSISRED